MSVHVRQPVAAEIVVVTIVCALNLRGISLAARASVVLATFSLAPFAVMLVLALLPLVCAAVSARAADPPSCLVIRDVAAAQDVEDG